MKFKEIVKRLKDQFIIKDLTQGVNFAITESTPEDARHKIITLDFGMNPYGFDNCRYVNVDLVLMAFKEFYGEEYLIKAIKEIKSYDVIKDVEMDNK